MAEYSGIAIFMAEDTPEIERFRTRHIRRGMPVAPLHVTVKYKFHSPGTLTDHILARVADVARTTPRFRFSALPLSAFAGASILYLMPSPVGPFEEVERKLDGHFPDLAEGNAHTYHLTVAHGYPKWREGAIARRFSRQLSDRFPLLLTADRLAVFYNNSDTGYTTHEFRIGE
jgi:2'-5' RNA ligase